MIPKQFTMNHLNVFIYPQDKLKHKTEAFQDHYI